ncbi:MAG: FAD-dependent oxidoreductase [Clostridiales bacterium]|nr:FAD-dependent oxidoreductase [Clostridiales bacterium]
MNRTVKEYDVVVLGAGPGGLAAALQAARNGAKVLLADKNGYLGGNMTIGLPLLGFLDKDGRTVIKGIAQEFIDDLRAYETPYGRAASEHLVCPLHNSVTLYDHEIFKFIAFRKVLDAGIEVLLHTDIISTNVEGMKLKSIELMGKSWRIEVRAKVFIDGTGDGDMAYLAGASYEKGQKGTGVLQPPTLMFTLRGVDTDKIIDFVEADPEQMNHCDTMECGEGFNAEFFRKNPNHAFVGLRKLFLKLKAEGKMPIDRDTLIYIRSLIPGEVHMNCTRHLGVDGSDVFSLTHGEIEGYLQIEKFVEALRLYVPGFEKCYITNIYPTLGIRETRRFKAITELTEEQVVRGDIGPDTVGLGSYIVDIHAGDGAGTIIKKIPPYGLPYGITVSSEIDGLMFAGRCAGMDAVVMSSARVMPICMAIGEGAGVGAALAVKYGISPRDVDVEEVRKILLDSNVLLEPEDK